MLLLVHACAIPFGRQNKHRQHVPPEIRHEQTKTTHFLFPEKGLHLVVFFVCFLFTFFPTIAQHHAPINALLGSNFLSALIRREKIIIRKANGAGGRARRLVVVVVVGESIGSRHSAAATCSTCYSMGVPAATVNDALRRPISKK